MNAMTGIGTVDVRTDVKTDIQIYTATDGQRRTDRLRGHAHPEVAVPKAEISHHLSDCPKVHDNLINASFRCPDVLVIGQRTT
jgi:hypothetical protein